MNLVASWIDTSRNPIRGDSQNSDGYWKAIANEFNKNRGTSKEKNYNQCKHRWAKINREVQQFVGCYKQAQSMKQSGQVDQDVMNRAREIFQQDPPYKSFNMEAAWVCLKDEPKWTQTNESASKRTKVSASGAYSSSSNPETPTSEYSPTSPTFVRPIGRNAAKKKGKQTSSVSQDEVDKEKLNLVERFTSTMEAVAKSQEAVAKSQELAAKAKLEEIKYNELACLRMDTSNMSEDQLADHEDYCAMIREKYRLRRR